MSRKLKGKVLVKLSKKKKDKMKKTLNRMNKTRESDSKLLRDVIKTKLAWLISNKQEGVKKLKDLKVKIDKLDGAILALQDVLKEVDE